MRHAMALAALFAWCACAAAADPAWPPDGEAQARIEALRRVLGDPAASAGMRRAAREQLVRLLMHPQARPDAVLAPKPPRAAVDPVAPLNPAAPALSTQPAVTPVAPPVRAANPVPDGRGGTLVPTGKHMIDPRTGALLVDTGNGWVDPATGRFVPR